jgi:hypothetical protein
MLDSCSTTVSRGLKDLAPLAQQLAELHAAWPGRCGVSVPPTATEQGDPAAALAEATCGAAAAAVPAASEQQPERQAASIAALRAFLTAYCAAHQRLDLWGDSAVAAACWPPLMSGIRGGDMQLLAILLSMLLQHHSQGVPGGSISAACQALQALHSSAAMDEGRSSCTQLMMMQLLEHCAEGSAPEALAEQLGSSGLVQLLVQQLDELDLEAGSSSKQCLVRIIDTLMPLRQCASLALHEAGALRALDALLLQVGPAPAALVCKHTSCCCCRPTASCSQTTLPPRRRLAPAAASARSCSRTWSCCGQRQLCTAPRRWPATPAAAASCGTWRSRMLLAFAAAATARPPFGPSGAFGAGSLQCAERLGCAYRLSSLRCRASCWASSKGSCMWLLSMPRTHLSLIATLQVAGRA